MQNYLPPAWQKSIFTLLRIAIGWHFLYEGIAKILTPGWSSASYLLNASGPLENMFKSMADSDFVVYMIDYSIIFGLIIIGLALFVGWGTRLAASLGALLLFTFYISNPPLSSAPVGYGVEGHYLIINKNLIELLTLLALISLPVGWFFSFDNISIRKVKPLHDLAEVPKEANHYLHKDGLSRRGLIKNLLAVPLLGGFVYSVVRDAGWGSYEEKHLNASTSPGGDAATGATVKVKQALDVSGLKEPIPAGTILDKQIGRLICGGNLISGFAHSRDLIYVSRLLKNYFTTEKVMDTFKICEACGINTTAVGTGIQERKILQKYRKQGGKIQWLAPVYPDEKDYKSIIDLAVDNGAMGTMLIGNLGDKWAREGKFDLINNVVEYARSKGVISGVAGHELGTFQGLENHGIAADFYMKTLHDTNYWSWRKKESKDKMVIDNYAIDNYWARKPEETIAFMDSLSKPWIAFKVLAAGALQPEKAFKYVFENGADFACVGMFDFQVVEDANLLSKILGDPAFNRKRPWRA